MRGRIVASPSSGQSPFREDITVSCALECLTGSHFEVHFKQQQKDGPCKATRIAVWEAQLGTPERSCGKAFSGFLLCLFVCYGGIFRCSGRNNVVTTVLRCPKQAKRRSEENRSHETEEWLRTIPVNAKLAVRCSVGISCVSYLLVTCLLWSAASKTA